MCTGRLLRKAAFEVLRASSAVAFFSCVTLLTYTSAVYNLKGLCKRVTFSWLVYVGAQGADLH